MGKLLFVGMIMAITCAHAEESFIGWLFSSNTNAATTATTSAENTALANLAQRIQELDAQIKSAKDMPKQKMEELKAKLKQLQEEQKAKLDAYRNRSSKDLAERRAKVEAEKAKAVEIKNSTESLINGIKGIFD